VVDAELMRQSFGSLDPNDIAAVMATTMPLALWLAVGNVRRRMLWTPCAIILVLAVIPTASRGGLLGLGVAAAVLVLVGAKGGKRIFLIASLVVGGIAFYALAGSQLDRMSDFATNDYNYTNSEGRIAIWKRGVVWMIRRPWGYGLDNFPTYFGWLNGPSRAAHNSFLQYGVELGVLGLAAYLLICWTLVRSLLNIRQNALHSGPAGQDTVVLCGHVLAMLAACWTTGFFLSHAYYPLTYMAIGIGSAVVLSAKGSAVVAAPAAPAKATAAGERRRRQLKAFDAA
jgi:O-antigen ligase